MSNLKVGDLIKYYPDHRDYDDWDDWMPKIGIVIKVKKLLMLYDILLQTENTVVKDVDIYSLEKIA